MYNLLNTEGGDEEYFFHIPREHLLELSYRIEGIPNEWYSLPIKKATNEKEQDEYYFLDVYRFFSMDGSAGEWVLYPTMTKRDGFLEYFEKSTISGKVLLKLFYDISQNGHTIDNEDGPVF